MGKNGKNGDSGKNDQPAAVTVIARPVGLEALRAELGHLALHWWWFLALGAAMVVLGIVAISSALIATVTAVTIFGVLLLVAGVGQLVMAFWAGRHSGSVMDILIGVLYIVVGFLLADAPVENAILLTFLLAVFFFVGGIVRVVAALMHRYPNWGWNLLAGAAAVLLGVFIIKGWPVTGLYVIGLFLGIELLFNGWAWIMLSLGLRSVHQG